MTNPIDAVEESQEYGLQLKVHEGYFDINRVRFLVYGESGSGKTVFSATWKDAVFLDANKGMSSVTAEVGVIAVNSWDDLVQAHKYLAYSKHPFKTVVIDSLNDVQRLCMLNIIKKFPSIRRPYEDLASQSDYGKMLDDFDKWLRVMIGLSMNVVLTCNVAPREYETDPVQPQLVGKHTSKTVAGMMDVIGYLTKQESAEGGAKDRLMIFDEISYITKDRSALLPSRMVNATHSKLMTEWNRQFDE